MAVGKKLLLIDNFDSFTYNLFQLIGVVGLEYGLEVVVRRNNELKLNEILGGGFSAVIISPGPGNPASNLGIGLELLNSNLEWLPILGVCLGHQAIAHVLGGVVEPMVAPKHGKTSFIKHSGQLLFRGIKNPLKVGRYHSLSVKAESLPVDLVIDATSEDDDQIMAFHHKLLPWYGVQFHPESFLTEDGHRLINNFISIIDNHR